MQIIYALESLPEITDRSIFLAGPIPRDSNIKSWRPEALEILKKLNFDGIVFSPERRDEKREREYDNQIDWEWRAMDKSTVVSFWVPRNLETMPAFTTNIEWGMWFKSGKVVLGYPENTPKMNYFLYCANSFNISVNNSLNKTLEDAIKKVNELSTV